MTEDELIAVIRIDRQTLTIWVESGWLQPVGAPPARTYSDVDLARAQLIADLIGPLGVNTEGIDIILDLIDQVHGLRAAIGGINRTLEAQPEEARQRFRAEIRRVSGGVRTL